MCEQAIERVGRGGETVRGRVHGRVHTMERADGTEGVRECVCVCARAKSKRKRDRATRKKTVEVATKGAMYEKEERRENMRKRRHRERSRARERASEKEHYHPTLATCWKTKVSPSCCSMPDEAQASR